VNVGLLTVEPSVRGMKILYIRPSALWNVMNSTVPPTVGYAFANFFSVVLAQYYIFSFLYTHIIRIALWPYECWIIFTSWTKKKQLISSNIANHILSIILDIFLSSKQSINDQIINQINFPMIAIVSARAFAIVQLVACIISAILLLLPSGGVQSGHCQLFADEDDDTSIDEKQQQQIYMKNILLYSCIASVKSHSGSHIFYS